MAAADKAKTQAQQDAKRAFLRARTAEGTAKALAVKLAPVTADLQEAVAKERQSAALIQVRLPPHELGLRAGLRQVIELWRPVVRCFRIRFHSPQLKCVRCSR